MDAKLKNNWSWHDIPSNMGMCKWFYKDTTKIQNARQRSTPKFFVGAKTLKIKVRNYSNYPITFPTIWRCAGDFFKGFADIQNCHHGSNLFFKGWNHSKFTFPTIWRCSGDFFKGFAEINNGHHGSTFIFKGGNHSNFTITFPMIWRCAGDFFKVLPKVKMAAMDELNNFFRSRKLKN